MIEWKTLDAGTPESDKQVVAEWRDNSSNNIYISYAVWDKTKGWSLIGFDDVDFTVMRWSDD